MIGIALVVFYYVGNPSNPLNESNLPIEKSDPTTPLGESPQDKSNDNQIDYVVAISIDGLNPNAIKRLGESGTPNLHEMIRSGVSTLNARTDYDSTRTLPNHTGMMTGRPLETTSGHGVDFNDDNGKIIGPSNGKPVESVFSVVHDASGSTALFAMKDKFKFLDRTWNEENGTADTTGADNGKDKIDDFYFNENDALVDTFTKQLKAQRYTFSFLHLTYPDTAGHRSGFMSNKYMISVQKTDYQIGKVLNFIQNDRALRDTTAIILTADHGGEGPEHSDYKSLSSYRIPFIVVGPGIPKNQNLYTLNNDTRKSPAERRVAYDEIQPIRNSDLANLATDLLDLPVVPGSVINSRQSLKVY